LRHKNANYGLKKKAKNLQADAVDEREIITELNARIRDLEDEVSDLQGSLDMQWHAIQRATDRWHKANPGTNHILPDTGRLLDWLLTQI
jgi:hypothetical protein